MVIRMMPNGMVFKTGKFMFLTPKFSRYIRRKSSFSVALETASKLVTQPNLLLNNPISLVSTEMATLVNNIMLLISSGQPNLNNVTSYYFKAEGKKIRPLLVLLLSRALAEIPYSERLLNSNIIESKPSTNFSPLNILHGINPLITSGETTNRKPTLEEQFDKKRGILPKQRRLAEVVEMIHIASLLHDDVIDNSDTRRGKPSGNIEFSNKMAVLAGDFLLGRATVAISRLGNPEVIEIMSNCIANLVEGEFMQLHNTNSNIDKDGEINVNALTHDYRIPQIDPKNSKHEEIIENAFQYYLHKSYLKTGSLISQSLRSTALLSSVKSNIVDQCYDFGKNIGLCFQLVDDMLDFTSNKKTSGKPIGIDLKLGISTAPVLFAWKEDKSLGDLINRNFSQPGDIDATLEAVAKYDGVQQTKILAEKYRDLALQNLRGSLPESDSRSALEFLTNTILTRKR